MCWEGSLKNSHILELHDVRHIPNSSVHLVSLDKLLANGAKCYDSLSVYLYALPFSLTFLVSHNYQHRWAARGNLCTYTTLPTLMFFFWYLFPIPLEYINLAPYFFVPHASLTRTTTFSRNR